MDVVNSDTEETVDNDLISDDDLTSMVVED